LVSLRYIYDHIVSHIVTRVTPLYPPFDVLCIHWSFRLRIYSHIVTTRHCYRHFASHVFTFNLLRSRSAISIQLLLYVRQTKGLAQPIARAPRRDTRRMRRARHTWQEITEHLATRHGLRLTRSALCHFFRRATRRPLPMGFEDPPTEEGAAAAISGPNANRLDAEGNSEKEARRNQGLSPMPVNQQKEAAMVRLGAEQGINYTPKE